MNIKTSPHELVHARRTIEYVGPRWWVEETLRNCAVKGRVEYPGGKSIVEVEVFGPKPLEV